MTTWTHDLCRQPGVATEVTARYLMKVLHEIDQTLQGLVPRTPTCYLLSESHLRELQEKVPEHVPPAASEIEKPPFAPLVARWQLYGVPVFVYRNAEERLTLRATLIQAGHYVCEVE